LKSFESDALTTISPGARTESRGTLPKPVATMRVRTPPLPPDQQPLDPVAIDLYLTRKPGANQLEIKTVFRALEGPLPTDPRWHKRTKKLFQDLKAYLIAQR
jgi:hypothetical protein